MIRCPTTGNPIPTGIETEPYCGLDHSWWKREAWLEDEPNGKISGSE